MEGQIFMVIFAVLIGASIIIPQIQYYMEKRNSED